MAESRNGAGLPKGSMSTVSNVLSERRAFASEEKTSTGSPRRSLLRRTRETASGSRSLMATGTPHSFAMRSPRTPVAPIVSRYRETGRTFERRTVASRASSILGLKKTGADPGGKGWPGSVAGIKNFKFPSSAQTYSISGSCGGSTRLYLLIGNG